MAPLITANAKWYFLRYYPAAGQRFIALSGQIVVPTLPSAGGYYLWPGLQTDSSGVYQNVLDGRSGTWWFSSEWYTSSPSFWGSGFNAYPGEIVSFSNNLNPSGSGWTTQILHETTGASIASIFALCKDTSASAPSGFADSRLQHKSCSTKPSLPLNCK